MEFEEKLKFVFDKNNFEILKFEGEKKKIVYKCLDCGQIYSFPCARNLFERITLCKKCYNPFTRWNKERCQERINKIFPNSELEVIQYVNVKTSKKTGQKTQIRCLKCGQIEEIKNFNALLCARKDLFCFNCEKKKIKEIISYKPTIIPYLNKDIEALFKENNDYVLLNIKEKNKKILVKHKCGFCFSVKLDKFLNKKECPKCKRIEFD